MTLEHKLKVFANRERQKGGKMSVTAALSFVIVGACWGCTTPFIKDGKTVKKVIIFPTLSFSFSLSSPCVSIIGDRQSVEHGTSWSTLQIGVQQLLPHFTTLPVYLSLFEFHSTGHWELFAWCKFRQGRHATLGLGGYVYMRALVQVRFAWCRRFLSLAVVSEQENYLKQIPSASGNP